MVVTREDMVEMLAEKSGYWKKDIRILLQHMDDLVFELLCEVTDEEEVTISLVRGAKLQCVPIKERPRKDPRDQSDIICRPTCKVKAKISEILKHDLVKNYDEKYNNKDG